MAKKRARVPDASIIADGRVLLHCPVRGPLKAASLAEDGLTQTEEARRIDFLKYLLDRKYPKSYISVETIVLKGLGESGRNVLRADVLVYGVPVAEVAGLPLHERVEQAKLVAEIKRDSSKQIPGITCQLEPAMRLLPGMEVIGAYWDDVSRLLFTKRLVVGPDGSRVSIEQDTLANLPIWGHRYRARPITLDSLIIPENFIGILSSIANILRSDGINDDRTRYTETVKLLLARYCDEKAAASKRTRELDLQVYPGPDPEFMGRVGEVYKVSARRYSRAKTLFTPVPGSELEERTLRRIVRLIQGVNLTSASNETMQQVFMSFVPAVFKKSLDQYFTPMSLIDTMVSMVGIGPNDRVADPAMGTADFLTAAMAHCAQREDPDASRRIHGIDIDAQAFDLAIVNMILNRDGMNNLVLGDSIAQHSLWAGEIDVVLCNPPFGARSIETRPSVLAHYDLGHVWVQAPDGSWEKTDEIRPDQQLGILFIERCFKMLAEDGRLAIILPEGYLCTAMYGYVRRWILDNLQVLSLTELPRRIFVKSDVDLRSNVLIAKRTGPAKLRKLKGINYPIHSELVRKVGFRMGSAVYPIVLRDPLTGLEVRDANNRCVLDTDFTRVREGFARFSGQVLRQFESYMVPLAEWEGAGYRDIAEHPTLDMKPRRLMPKALANLRSIKSGEYSTLGSIAEVLEDSVDVLDDAGRSALRRLVVGLDIRAVEGTVIPGLPRRAWEIAEGKSRFLYKLKHRDIVIGLVRPERRNIGLLLDRGGDIVADPGGVAVVRVRPLMSKEYPQEWLFAILRSEACRLQFWTESGGTSYGKLTSDHIKGVLIAKPAAGDVAAITRSVSEWASEIEKGRALWESIGSEEDRMPIINSAIHGLAPDEDVEQDDE